MRLAQQRSFLFHLYNHNMIISIYSQNMRLKNFLCIVHTRLLIYESKKKSRVICIRFNNLIYYLFRQYFQNNFFWRRNMFYYSSEFLLYTVQFWMVTCVSSFKAYTIHKYSSENSFSKLAECNKCNTLMCKLSRLYFSMHIICNHICMYL